MRRCHGCHIFSCSYIYCIFYLSCDIWYNLCWWKPLSYKHNAYFYAFRKDIGIFCASGFYARVPVWLQLPLHGFHKSRLPCCLWTITLQLHVDLSVYFRNGHNRWILYPEGSIYSSGLCLLECSLWLGSKEVRFYGGRLRSEFKGIEEWRN